MARPKIKKICRYPGCRISTYQKYCDLHPEGPPRKPDNRPSASARGYDRHWQKERAFFLSQNPLCAECDRQGDTTPAVLVDHVKAHKGNMSLFWDVSNWQSLCDRCHRIKSAKEDGAMGNPVK